MIQRIARIKTREWKNKDPEVWSKLFRLVKLGHNLIWKVLDDSAKAEFTPLSQPLLARTLAPCKFRSSRSSRLQFELSLSKWQIKFNSNRRTAVNDGVLFINTKRSCQPLRMTRAPNESPSIVRSPFFRPQKKSFFRIPLDKGPNESRLVQTRSDGRSESEPVDLFEALKSLGLTFRFSSNNTFRIHTRSSLKIQYESKWVIEQSDPLAGAYCHIKSEAVLSVIFDLLVFAPVFTSVDLVSRCKTHRRWLVIIGQYVHTQTVCPRILSVFVRHYGDRVNKSIDTQF